MTLKEALEQARKEEEARQQGLTIEDVAQTTVTEGIPSLIKGAASLPVTLVQLLRPPGTVHEEAKKAVVDYAYDRWNNPAHAIPDVAMLAGGALGAAVGLPNVGALVGTALGTQLRHEIEGTPWTKTDVGDVMLAPLANLPFAAAGAAYRTAKGIGQKTTKAETIYTSTRLQPHQIEYADDILAEAKAKIEAKRAAAFSDSASLMLAKTGDKLEKMADAPFLKSPTGRTLTATTFTDEELAALRAANTNLSQLDNVYYDVRETASQRLQRRLDEAKQRAGAQQAVALSAIIDPAVSGKKADIRLGALSDTEAQLAELLQPADAPTLYPKAQPTRAAPLVEKAGFRELESLASREEVKAAKEALKVAKRDPHWLQRYEKEQRRQAQRQAAQEQIANHVAEKEAKLRVDDTVKGDPWLSDLWEDRRHLARISVLEPEHLQPDNNPFVREARKAGFLASWMNPHSNLLKLGKEGHYTSQLLMEAKELYETGVLKLQERAHAVMDKYNIQEHDLKTHGLSHILFEHPDVYDGLKAKGPGFIKEWEQATGNRLNVKPEDYGRLHQLTQFFEELQDQAMNVAWAFALDQGADPRRLAQYNRRYMFPTFTARRTATELQDDVERIDRALTSLSEVERASEHGQLLLQQKEALQRKLTVATKAATEQDASRAAHSQTLYRKGMKPGDVFNSAYRDKHTDMMFGTGFRSSVDDYLRGFLKKAVYDPVNERVNEVIRAAPWDPSTKRWVTALALDQLGTRRRVGIQALTNYIKRVPGLGKHVSEETVERAINTAGAYNYAVNLGLNPRFYPVNATQLLTMGYGLVGGDGLAHGMMKALTDWPTAYKEAAMNGAVQSGLHSLWEELGTNSNGHKIVRFTKDALKRTNKALVASEAFNRTVLYHAGKFIAEKEGLTGREAVRRARDINRMANFGYSAAERPTVTGSLGGSLALRYRSFGMQYVSNLKHLLKHDPKAAAESLAMILALGGTSAVPLYGAVQDMVAEHFGGNLPNLAPFDEATGLDMSASFSPWLSLPGVSEDLTVESLAGPILGPPIQAARGAMSGDTELTAKGISGLIGAGIMRPIRAVDEYMRGGLTTTDSGKPLIRRDPERIFQSALGLRSTARGEAFKHAQAIRRAEQTGVGKLEALENAEKAGVLGLRQMLATARRLKAKEETKKSLLDELRGR